MSNAHQVYRIGSCPACQHDITAEAVVELEPAASASPPDPRQEGAVTLKGKIVGASIREHSCVPKVTR